ncbi:MAG: hypothetical protein J6I52_03000 [Prevotella sp.]|nr:hypothetical protein [Prevotella sp.]
MRAFSLFVPQTALFYFSSGMSERSCFSLSLAAISSVFLLFATIFFPLFGGVMSGFRKNHDSIQETSRDDLGYIAS